MNLIFRVTVPFGALTRVDDNQGDKPGVLRAHVDTPWFADDPRRSRLDLVRDAKMYPLGFLLWHVGRFYWSRLA